MPDFNPTQYKSEYNKQHYTQLKLWLTPEEKASIQAAAAAANMSLREYILSLIQK